MALMRPMIRFVCKTGVRFRTLVSTNGQACLFLARLFQWRVGTTAGVRVQTLERKWIQSGRIRARITVL